MKTIEYIKKTKWDFMYHIFITKKFQGLVIAFDFDVPQADYLTVCVITIKLFFIGGWISFDRKYSMIPRLSKYKAGGIIEGSKYYRQYCYNCQIETPVIETEKGRCCINCGLMHY